MLVLILLFLLKFNMHTTPVANRKTTKIRPWFLELDRFPRLKMYINNGINHLILFKFKNKIIENLPGSKKKTGMSKSNRNLPKFDVMIFKKRENVVRARGKRVVPMAHAHVHTHKYTYT